MSRLLSELFVFVRTTGFLSLSQRSCSPLTEDTEPEAFLTRVHYRVMYAYMESPMYVDRNLVGRETRGRKSRVCSH